MSKQNVTLSISKDILRKAKILAIEKDTSLSGLLTKTLTDLVEEADLYQVARERHMALLKESADLGTDGKINWTRDELHDR